MKRTELKRSKPLVRRDAGKAEAKINARRCKACKQPYTPTRPMQTACCGDCAIQLAIKGREKLERFKQQEEKRNTRARLEALKTISQLEEECRKIVQKLARIRDRNDGCISCHMPANYQGQWHGSHYRAHGGCSSLQFHLWNIHKACAQCNLYKGGNKEGFIQGLLNKPGYGRERLDWLDNQPKSQKFSREYLCRFKNVMGKRCRRMEKRNA